VAFGAEVTTAAVKMVECPRDAWQGMPQQIPAAIKANYLQALMAAGFRHIDAVSFVSPTAVPQMSDSEQVLALLDPDSDVEIIGIVVNRQGAERALRSRAVDTLGFPYSLSPTFLERNQKQTPAKALETLTEICALASTAGVGVVAYLSMAFGNPYGDPWRPDDVIAACQALKALGLKEISLADTVGVAQPEQIESLIRAVLAAVPGVELGAHLHARPQQAAEKVAAAYRAGCRRLDSALGGQGGCPFAQDALVGNLATEAAIAELGRLGAKLPRLAPLDPLLTMSQELAARFAANQGVLEP
jgi:hydroxymethylglutaryl-CoA lyase